jgi:hypothetical protein
MTYARVPQRASRTRASGGCRSPPSFEQNGESCFPATRKHAEQCARRRKRGAFPIAVDHEAEQRAPGVDTGARIAAGAIMTVRSANST